MTKRKSDDVVAHNPHDGLVKRIFTNPEAAAAELRQVLPAALTSRLDWKTLRVEPSSFIDPELEHRTSDILYSIALSGSTRRISIYVVLEHQSTPDPVMAARFVVYVGRLYERYLSEHKGTKKVPLVAPVLLYQGPKGWTMPQRLSEMLDVPPELLEAFPSPVELAFAVDDLGESVLGDQVTHDQLVRNRGLALAEMARTMLWLYHHPEATDGERAALLGVLGNVVAETWGAKAVKPFLTYFLSVFGPESPVRGILLESASKETRQMYATIRDELLAKGRAEGHARIVRVLERLMDNRGLTLTDELRERVATCEDEDLLQRWFDRAVRASSLTEIFDD
ncbi:MAG: Rpn family recombination-promoting nuclease/putative transposase [Myxococcales bacterium]|nr:Rpn family recombination-promoting nuclease/putative transposase [Myxococcales bacterium]MCB9716276.1 Rpn family recombination-promoting nuclease/putative transposase [Myxococcales bacterium]